MPLSWVIDPDLLDSAADMSKPAGYLRVAGDGTQPGTGGISAAAWLDQIRTATATSEVVALPYADPDITALRRGGLSSDVTNARDGRHRGRGTRVLGRQVTDDVAWPIDGFTDRKTLALAGRDGHQDRGSRRPGTAHPARAQLHAERKQRMRTPSGPLTALAGRPRADRPAAATPRSNPLLAAQRFLAETAMITAELPSAGTGTA